MKKSLWSSQTVLAILILVLVSLAAALFSDSNKSKAAESDIQYDRGYGLKK